MNKGLNLSDKVSTALTHLHRQELPAILKIQGEIIRATHRFMELKGVIPVQPLMLSPITDPLCHDVSEAEVEYAGNKFSMMKSMILHKQLLLTHDGLNAIYIISPNIRLEGPERKDTGRHLFEFTQVDFEFKNKTRDFVVNFMEDLVRYVFTAINQNLGDELKKFRNEWLPIPLKFKQYSTHELNAKYGENWEQEASKAATDPFWVMDHKREFYDKEDPANPGHYINYDIMWPEGFGEGLSGAEREFEYDQLLKRMKANNTSVEVYKDYVELAKAGLLQISAGGGFGVERMTRFITRRKDIDEVTCFSRKPYGNITF